MQTSAKTSYITVFDGPTPHHVLVKRADVRRVVLRLGKDNALTVTAPLEVSDQYLIDFISKHISQFVAKQKVRTKNAKLDLARGIVALYGKTYALKPVKCASVRQQRLEFIDESCYAHVQSLSTDRIEQVVKKGYVALAERKLAADVVRIAKITGVKPSKLSVKWVSGKWGHWNSRNSEMLLAAQLLTHSQSEIDYVIFHEMAHAFHPNHGQQFWALVKEWYGDYASAKRALRDEDV